MTGRVRVAAKTVPEVPRLRTGWSSRPAPPRPRPTARAHVVAGPGRDRDSRGQPQRPGGGRGQGAGAGRPGGGDLGEQSGVQAEQCEDLRVVGAGGGGVPAGARGVPGVGDGGAREPFGEEVVREPHGRRGGGVRRVPLAQPLPLRRGEGGHRRRTGPRGPGAGAAERGGEGGGLRCGTRVVPQERGAQRPAGPVQHDEPVLLPGHRDAGDGGGGHPGLLHPGTHGLAQRPPPDLGVALPRPAVPADQVRGAADGERFTPHGVDDDRLGGLRGAVHADDDGTRRHGLPHSLYGYLVARKTNYANEPPSGRGLSGLA
ncbi:hypothetical protein ACVWXU_002215 [Streptomyces sp. TE33382]